MILFVARHIFGIEKRRIMQADERLRWREATNRFIDIDEVSVEIDKRHDIGVVVEERAESFLAFGERILGGERFGNVFGIGERVKRAAVLHRERRPTAGAHLAVRAVVAVDVDERADRYRVPSRRCCTSRTIGLSSGATKIELVDRFTDDVGGAGSRTYRPLAPTSR